MLPRKLAFIDVETTGLSSTFDRIIEIGVLRVEDNQITKTLNSLVDPGYTIPEEIVNITGITSRELESAPSFRQIKDDVIQILKDCIIVGHNVRFDYSFLKNEFKRLDFSFSSKQFCTVKLSKKLFPHFKHHNLSSIIERFNFECERRHRAFDDAKVLWDFYKLIQEQFSQEKIEQALSLISKRPSLPINLPAKILSSLPESPGVYIFYGDNNIPLYVGKSVDIKTRVLSHFSADHSSSSEMKISQQIKNIETIKTNGELGALLKESALIKTLQPVYNRMLRHKHELVVAKKAKTDSGYETVKLDTLNNIPITELSEILGVYKNSKRAKEFLLNIAKEHSLCEKLLGLEKTKGSCFGYKLGRCKGACLGKELNLKYNLRFYEAFSKDKIMPWPFSGPVIIKEKDFLENSEMGFLVHNWCFIKELDQDLEKTGFDYNFDLDIYHILRRYFKNPLNQKNIKVLSGNFDIV